VPDTPRNRALLAAIAADVEELLARGRLPDVPA